jgi:hypothetical protein
MKDNNNQLKSVTLARLEAALEVVNNKLSILEVLDQDTSDSGMYDLRDQLFTMWTGLDTLKGAVSRAKTVVPTD